MGFHQVELKPSRRLRTINLIARLYPANGCKAFINVTARTDPLRPELKRFVVVNGELMGHRTQAYTHDVEVGIKKFGRRYTFRIFFKRHKKLPLNRSMQALKDAGVRGDILVVALGPKVGARAMCGKEGKVADYLIQKITACFTIPAPKRVPKYWPRR